MLIVVQQTSKFSRFFIFIKISRYINSKISAIFVEHYATLIAKFVNK